MVFPRLNSQESSPTESSPCVTQGSTAADGLVLCLVVPAVLSHATGIMDIVGSLRANEKKSVTTDEAYLRGALIWCDGEAIRQVDRQRALHFLTVVLY
jgi:hypothetical protein